VGVKVTGRYRCAPNGTELAPDGMVVATTCTYETYVDGEVVAMNDSARPHEADFYPIGQLASCPRHGPSYLYLQDISVSSRHRAAQ
jgi:hypothetical protein